jgi:hypothetical protein
MTNNEQIDVSGCDYRDDQLEDDCAIHWFNPKCKNHQSPHCDDNENCIYRQLQREKQENAFLKDEKIKFCDAINALNQKLNKHNEKVLKQKEEELERKNKQLNELWIRYENEVTDLTWALLKIKDFTCKDCPNDDDRYCKRCCKDYLQKIADEVLRRIG